MCYIFPGSTHRETRTHTLASQIPDEKRTHAEKKEIFFSATSKRLVVTEDYTHINTHTHTFIHKASLVLSDLQGPATAAKQDNSVISVCVCVCVRER